MGGLYRGRRVPAWTLKPASPPGPVGRLMARGGRTSLSVHLGIDFSIMALAIRVSRAIFCVTPGQKVVHSDIEVVLRRIFRLDKLLERLIAKAR